MTGSLAAAAYIAAAASLGGGQDWSPLGKALSQLKPKPAEGQTQPAAGTGASPIGNPGGPTQQLPPPARDPKEEFKVISAEEFSRDGTKIRAKGGVKLQYRGYDLAADEIVGDTVTEVFVLTGNAKVLGEGADVQGNEIEVDTKRRVFRYLSARAKLGPEQIGGEFQGNLFITSDSGAGTGKEIRTSHGHLTTCDLDHPHYHIESGSTLIVPERYARLSDVRVKILGTTVLRLPTLILPLNDASTRNVPEFGQSEDEGYYLKTKFGTPLRGNDYLNHRVDLMEKKGVGLGTEWVYDLPNRMAGRLDGYILSGPSPARTLTADHRMGLAGGELSLGGQYNESNYLTSPLVTSFNGRSQYVLPWGTGTSRLGYNLSSSRSSGFSSKNETWTLADTRKFGLLNTSLDAVLNSSESRGFGGFVNEQERIDLRFTTAADLKQFSADLLYQRGIPVKGQAFTSSSDRTPLLTLKSTTSKLFGQKSGSRLPINFSSSVGEMFEAGRDGPLTRMNFSADTNGTRNLGDLTISYGGRFEQGLYSDDTAQYLTGWNAQGALKLFGSSRLNVGYRNQKTMGYTPLSIDRFGQQDGFNADVSLVPLRDLTFYAGTGYDVLQGEQGFVPWQSVNVRGEWTPNRTTKVRSTALYDTFSQLWGSASFDADFMIQKARFVVGTRYDGRRKKISNASLLASGLSWGRLGASVLVDWNGFTEELQALHYQLVWDMHCSEAVLEVIDNRSGFRSGQQIGFYVRLKAFPTFSAFGFGRGGQAAGFSGR